MGRAIWGDFEVDLDRVLGRGGMGTVYAARQLSLDREVAVKVLDLSRVESADMAEGFLQRFRIEIAALARAKDPRILSIIQAGENDGRRWFAMELVEGRTLDKHIDGGHLTSREAARVGGEVARALAAAAREGILHRDVKPGNIFLSKDGSVKLGDWGLARAKGFAPTKLTEADAMACTPHYASPEIAAGEEVDFRSDIYSLGVVLYEMVTECPPFHGDSPVAVLYGHRYETLTAPSVYNPDVDPRLERIIGKCLEKDPERRYQSHEELISELEAVVQPAPAVTRAPRGRFLAVALSGVAVVLLAAAALVWKPFQKRPSAVPASDDAAEAKRNERPVPPHKPARGPRATAMPAGKFPPSVPAVDPRSPDPWVKRLSLLRIGRAASPTRGETIQAQIGAHSPTAEELPAIRSALGALRRQDSAIQSRDYAAAIAELEAASRRTDLSAYAHWIIGADLERLRSLRELEKSRKDRDEATFYAAAGEAERIFWLSTHFHPARALALLRLALDPANPSYSPALLPHAPGLIHAIVLRAIASIDPKETAAARKTLGDIRSLAKVFPGTLRWAFLPCDSLAYEIEAAEALGRKDFETLFLKFERSRFIGPTAKAKLRASLLPDELVGEVEFIAWQRDVADAPGGEITLERNPERYRLQTARARDRAWLMKRFGGAKQGYQVRWRLGVGGSVFVVSLFSRDNPDRRRFIEIASTAATLYRSDSGTLRRVSTAKFPSATARGAVAVVPVAGLTLVFLNDRLAFVLSAREYPLDDGIRLGAAGTVEVESIRVVNRDR